MKEVIEQTFSQIDEFTCSIDEREKMKESLLAILNNVIVTIK